MTRIPCVGNSGATGWTIDPDELRSYFEHMARHWEFFSSLWYWVFPPQTEYRIAFATGDGVEIRTPTPWMMAMLRRGGVIRHMRQIDSFGPREIPVFEGSGEFLAPMTDRAAAEFVAWKDIPREVNHRVVMMAEQIPTDRSRRNEWRLGERGIELPA